MSDIFSTRVFNLLQARKRMGSKLTKDALADALGCSRTMLYNYENGDPEPEGEILSRLAKLEEDAGIESLFSPFIVGEDQAKYHVESKTRMIPVLSWAHAGEAESYEELPKSWQEMVPTECPDDDAFSVILNGDSMEPRFYAGDQLIVMPNKRPVNGGLVVCRFKDDGIIFRQIEVIGEKIRLVPINVRYAPTDHTEDDFSWIYPLWGMYRQLCK